MCQLLDFVVQKDHPKRAKKELNFGEKCRYWTAGFVQMFGIYNLVSFLINIFLSYYPNGNNHQPCHYRMIRRTSWRPHAWENISLAAHWWSDWSMPPPASKHLSSSQSMWITPLTAHCFPAVFIVHLCCACYWVDGWPSTGCVLCVDAALAPTNTSSHPRAHHQCCCCCQDRTSLAYAPPTCARWNHQTLSWLDQVRLMWTQMEPESSCCLGCCNVVSTKLCGHWTWLVWPFLRLPFVLKYVLFQIITTFPNKTSKEVSAYGYAPIYVCLLRFLLSEHCSIQAL